MFKIIVTDQQGEHHQLECSEGQSLMELLREHKFDEISAICGGSCSCATCHVHIAKAHQDRLSPIEEDELELVSLSDNYIEDSSRLSCQIELHEGLDGLEVQIIETD